MFEVFCVIIFLFLVLGWQKEQKKPLVKTSPPEPEGSLPILGHLRILCGLEPTYKVLARLADKYGPIIKIRLGVRQVVVVSSLEMANECLVTNDQAFANRAKILAIELLSFNQTVIAFSPPDSCWRELRKITTFNLLSKQSVVKLKKKMVYEVRTTIGEVYHRWVDSNQESVSVEMREWFGKICMRIMLQAVVGRISEEHEKQLFKAVRDFHLAGIFTMSVAFPYLQWLDIGGYVKFMNKTAEELDFFANSCLESHRERRSNPAVTSEEKNFMDTLIDIFDKEDAQMFNKDASTIIKSVSMTMILAATDPTSATVTWALCLLLNNPHTLKKVKEELDTHIGRERNLDIESDLSKLVYLQSVIKETLRLHPPSPMTVPREAATDVVIGGYNIPAGTILYINLHKLHRDPLIWEDPCAFRPERFLAGHKHVDLINSFELIPFSLGKRGCPGKFYALQVITFILASLLHSFDIAPAMFSSTPVDMFEFKGLTSYKATPLDVLLIPRLPHHLYA